MNFISFLLYVNIILCKKINYRLSDRDEFSYNFLEIMKYKKFNDIKLYINNQNKNIKIKEANIFKDEFKDYKILKTHKIDRVNLILIVEKISSKNKYIIKKEFLNYKLTEKKIDFNYEKIVYIKNILYFIIKKNNEVKLFDCIIMKFLEKDKLDIQNKIKDIKLVDFSLLNNFLYIKTDKVYNIYLRYNKKENLKKIEKINFSFGNHKIEILTSDIEKIIFTNFFYFFVKNELFICKYHSKNIFKKCIKTPAKRIINNDNFLNQLLFENNKGLILIKEKKGNLIEINFNFDFNYKEYDLNFNENLIYGNDKNNNFFIYFIENKLFYNENSFKKKCFFMLEYFLCFNNSKNYFEKYYFKIQYKLQNNKNINNINIKYKNNELLTIDTQIENDVYKIYHKNIVKTVDYNFIDSYFMHKLFLKGNNLDIYTIKNKRIEELLYFNNIDNDLENICEINNYTFVKFYRSIIIILCQKNGEYYLYENKINLNLIDKEINFNSKSYKKIKIKNFDEINGISLQNYKLLINFKNNEYIIYLVNKNKLITLYQSKIKISFFNKNKKYINCYFNIENYICHNEREIDIKYGGKSIKKIIKKIRSFILLYNLKIKFIKFLNFKNNILIVNLYNDKNNFIFKLTYRNHILKVEKNLVLKSKKNINFFCYFSNNHYFKNENNSDNFNIHSIYNDLHIDYGVFFGSKGKILDLLCKYEYDIIIAKYEYEGNYYFNFLKISSQLNERLIKKLKIKTKNDEIISMDIIDDKIIFLIKIDEKIKSFIYFKEGPFLIINEDDIINKNLYLKKQKNYLKLLNYKLDLNLKKKFSKNKLSKNKTFYLEINKFKEKFKITNDFNLNILDYNFDKKNEDKLDIYKMKEKEIFNIIKPKKYKYFYFNTINNKFNNLIKNKEIFGLKDFKKLVIGKNVNCEKLINKFEALFCYNNNNYEVRFLDKIIPFYNLNHFIISLNLIEIGSFKLLFAINEKNKKEILVFGLQNKKFHLIGIFNSMYYFNDNKNFEKIFVYYNKNKNYIHFISYEKFSNSIYFFTMKDFKSLKFNKQDFNVFNINDNLIKELKCYQNEIITKNNLKFECSILLENYFKIIEINYNENIDFRILKTKYNFFDFSNYIVTSKSVDHYLTNNYIILKSKNKYSHFDFLIYKKNKQNIQLAGHLKKNEFPIDYHFEEDKEKLIIYILLLRDFKNLIIKKIKFYNDLIVDINKLTKIYKSKNLSKYIYLKEKINISSLNNQYNFKLKIFICTESCIKRFKICYIILFTLIFISNSILIIFFNYKTNSLKI